MFCVDQRTTPLDKELLFDILKLSENAAAEKARTNYNVQEKINKTITFDNEKIAEKINKLAKKTLKIICILGFLSLGVLSSGIIFSVIPSLIYVPIIQFSAFLSTGVSSAIYLSNFFKQKKVYEELNKTQASKALNALVLFSVDDWNGAFKDKAEIIYSLIQKYNIFTKYIKTPDDFDNITDKKYDLLMICGHGNTNRIIFKNWNFELTKDNLNSFDFPKLTERAIVCLNSCSTGAKGGIGEKIAAKTQRTVFAPTEKPSHDKYFFDENGISKIEFYKYRFFKIGRKIEPSKFNYKTF